VSSEGRPEFEALDELRDVLHSVTEELASWRRRALKAESEQTELGLGHDAVASREQLAELESDNNDMQQRLETAKARVEELLTRLRFLEEQVAAEESGR
jgi:chromosome segregation ATPase